MLHSYMMKERCCRFNCFSMGDERVQREQMVLCHHELQDQVKPSLRWKELVVC